MTLYPFTPSGVQDKLTQLYALPDELLSIEANEIELDFVDWMKDNFDLSTDQQDFLDNINEDAINYYGSQCALCFRHRLEIILIYPNPVPGYAKYPETTNTIKVVTDENGNIEVTGSLTFTMTYRPHGL